MPVNGALVHIGVFALGTAIGASVAGTIVSRKKPIPAAPLPPSSSPPLPTSQPPPHVPSSSFRGPTSDVLKFGNPGPVVDLLERQAYVAGYDRRLRHPSWTAEHLTPATIARRPNGSGGGDRGNSVFKEDESIPLPFRARLADYFRSGYDRGHMVPAADAKASQSAMDETFFLSNMAPQVGAGFNRHYWAYLEDWCRRLTGTFPDVYVFTLPLYLPKQNAEGKWHVTHEVIGSPPNVSVPTHFAKVVLATRPANPANPSILEASIGAFVLPNAIIPDDAPLESFSLPVEAVERAAGLTLFSDAVKNSAKHICKTTKCQLIIRRFDDAQQKQARGPKSTPAIAAPK